MKTAMTFKMNTATHNDCAYQCGTSCDAKFYNFVHVVFGAACTFVLSLVSVAAIIKGAIISAVFGVLIIRLMTTGYIGPNKIQSFS